MADCIKQHAECILIRARGEVIAGWSVLGGGLAWAAAAYITLENNCPCAARKRLGIGCLHWPQGEVCLEPWVRACCRRAAFCCVCQNQRAVFSSVEVSASETQDLILHMQAKQAKIESV